MAVHAAHSSHARNTTHGAAKRPRFAAGSTKARATTFVARAGYLARGVVYTLIGGIALGAAFGGQNAEGSRGALASLTGEPFGKTLLVLVGIGLFAYALWQALRAFLDADNDGADARGIAKRTAYFFSGVAHVLLGFYALAIVFDWTFGLGAGGGGGDDGAQSLSARVLAWNYGRWILGLIGAAFIGGGLAQFGKAYTASFRKQLDLEPRTLDKISPVCRAGLTARGVAFALIGGFLIYAAWTHDASRARGLGGAIASLREQPFGQWLIALMGLGLIAFAAFSFVQGYARRISAG